MDQKAVEIENLSIQFHKSTERIDSFKEYLIKIAKRDLSYEKFWALKDVSLSINRGETVGIIGLNGSGKSTLLKVIAGVLKPAEGSVRVNGSVAPLIELGAGFDPDLSARENIFLNGAVLGHSRKRMQELFEEIIEFAELREFLDVPLKNYSSGMQARLGFAIATSVTPDVLIVDEVLGVGDYQFQEKCHRRMERIISSGATVLFVSHSIEQVKQICSRAIWLKNGRVVMDGEVNQVCDEYMKR